MKKTIICFVTGFLFIASIVLSESSINLLDDQVNKIYVSKKGNDLTGTGSLLLPFLTIGKAIEISTNIDTIIVEEGDYNENFDLVERTVILKSKTGPELTTIDGNSLKSVFKLTNCSMELDGFTIEKGKSNFIGGGIQALSSDLRIENCVFQNNEALVSNWARGGAIGFNNMDSALTNTVTIRNSRFENNFAANYGGGVAFKTSGKDSSGLDLLIENCDFINNTSGGIGGFIIEAYERSFEVTTISIEGLNTNFEIINCNFSGDVNTAEAVSAFIINRAKGQLRRCLFLPAGNEKEGEIHRAVHLGTSSTIEFMNCTIIKNDLNDFHNVVITAGSKVKIENSILWGGDKQIHLKNLYGMGGTLNIDYSDVQNGVNAVLIDSLSLLNWDDGNIAENPMFCDPENFDYHIKEGSPCIGSGENGQDMGKFGAGCTIVNVEEIQVETFDLHLANYPNPFNNSTVIEFNNPEAGPVDLKIYDIQGRLVKTLKNKFLETGNFKVMWNGTNDYNTPVSSGIYLCLLRLKDQTQSVKLVYTK